MLINACGHIVLRGSCILFAVINELLHTCMAKMHGYTIANPHETIMKYLCLTLLWCTDDICL